MYKLNTQLPPLKVSEEPLFEKRHIYGFVFLLTVGVLLISVIYNWQYGKIPHDGSSNLVDQPQHNRDNAVVCIQVVDYARNKETGVIKAFPTPCDVPEGWESIGSEIVADGAKGFVEGSLSYPSEGIPTNMKICATNLFNKYEYCVYDHIKNSKYDYGVGYKMDLPVGKYYVFAQVRSTKAYYSEYVTCGLKAECTSHAPIVVQVYENKITNNIDPGDWYTQ